MRRVSEKERTKENEDKGLNNLQFGLLTFLISIIIMAGILVGAFYLIIHNNVYGIADKYRKDIRDKPLLKWALPESPDPEDPEYMSDTEVRKRYTEIKKEKDELQNSLNKANKTLGELNIYKEAYEKVLLEREEEEIRLTEERKKIEEDREEIQRLSTEADKSGFKQYYENMEKGKAEILYREILLEEKAEADIKEFVRIYESMDETAAAKIFNEMGEEKIHLIIDILLRMKKDNSSAVLAEMDSALASKVTEKMAEEFLK